MISIGEKIREVRIARNLTVLGGKYGYIFKYKGTFWEL